jgi:hypothetical protein
MSLTSYRAAPPRVTKFEPLECGPEAFSIPAWANRADGGLLHPAKRSHLRRQRRKKGRA